MPASADGRDASRRVTLFALGLIGFTAVVAQVLLMRELLVVFFGNELSLGLMLANWLLWTAVGSAWPMRPCAALRQEQRRVARLEVAVALLLPLTLLAARTGRLLFQPVAGELLGPTKTLLFSFVLLAGFCTVSGRLFPAGSQLYARQTAAAASAATSQVYWLEAIGSAVGGLAAGWILLSRFGPFRIALLTSALNLTAAAALALGGRRRRATLAILALATLAAPTAASRLETTSQSWLWRGLRVREVRNSPYGNLAVIETEGSRTLYENGLVVGSVPDPAEAEEAVHYALLQHAAPRRVLLLGGGWNGSLREALQHPSIEQVDYAELDPAILELADRYFADAWIPARNDPRVRVHVTDGRLYLKTAPGDFDVIIVNLPEPATAQLNRFYTAEFFRLAARKLRPDGVLTLRLRGSENYISPELARFLAAIRRTLHAAFAEVAVLPGDPVHFFAARGAGALVRDAEALEQRLRTRGLATRYVREYYFRFRWTPLRVEQLEAAMAAAAPVPLNRDFTPIAYYFDAVLWGAQFNPGYRDAFQAVASVDFGWLLAGAAVLWLAAVGLAGRRQPGRVAVLAVGGMGFTLIALEVLLLLGFQVLYGYLYQQLAVVIAAFMAGMALGGRQALVRTQVGAVPLWKVQTAAAAAPLLLYGLFELLGRVASPAGLWAAAHGGIPLLAAGVGWLGGFQFPVASRLYFRGPQTGFGRLYAADLVGACLGAMAVSTYLLPVFGFWRTASLLGVANLITAAAAARCRPREEST